MATNGAIVQRGKPSTTMTLAQTPKKKVGRKPAGESKSAQHQMLVTEWKLTPERLRKPSTIVELANEIGISKEMVKYYIRKSVDNIGEFVEDIEQRAITGDYPEIVDKMGELAKKGHPEMAKLFMRQIVEPRRIEPKKGSPLDDDPVLQQAIRVLVRPGEETIAVEATAIVRTEPPKPR